MPVCFSSEVVPIFTKAGCNSGGCHGKAMGQNGFKLSLLGFDPGFDYEALVREGRGRRVFPAAPEASLLLTKSTARVPHGGGRKFAVGSPEYKPSPAGSPRGRRYDTGKEPKIDGAQRLARPAHARPQGPAAASGRRAVTATATTTDVTRLAQFTSNSADLATVDPEGLVATLESVGEAAIMVRFGGQVTVARATIPLGRDDVPSVGSARDRRISIDTFVFGKLKRAWAFRRAVRAPTRSSPGGRHSTSAASSPARRRSRARGGHRPRQDDEVGRSPAGTSRVRGLLRDEVVGDPPESARHSSVGQNGQIVQLRLPRLGPRGDRREPALRPDRVRADRRQGRPGAEPGRLVVSHPRLHGRRAEAAQGPGRRHRPALPRACGSAAPSAIITRSRSGARTTTTASPRSSPASGKKPGE